MTELTIVDIFRRGKYYHDGYFKYCLFSFNGGKEKLLKDKLITSCKFNKNRFKGQLIDYTKVKVDFRL
jgi:hypothetical protein